MEIFDWENAILDKLAGTNELGCDAANFIRRRKVKIKFRQYSKSTGARWLLRRRITLNSHYYSSATALNDPGMLSLLIHEVHHLRQGMLTALSVYGELDAWQVGYRFYKMLDERKLHPALEELLVLPLNRDRDILRRAAQLMQVYAGRGYHINWLPLYPLHEEIVYWLTGLTKASRRR
ncbi:MAG: hypothetical protein L3J16_05055 [Anaerolineales bacterium]|nr:hypothetical protein [Anaerolineales bacterium]